MGLESLGKKLAQLGQDTVNSVQKTAENVQMNNRIADEKKALDKLFAQIGESIFEKAGDVVPEGLEDLFEAVKNTKSAIADLEEQKKKVRGKRVCPSCGKEAGKGEKFCSACGTALPAEDEAQDDGEQLRQNVADAASEVGDIVNDAADKAKGFFSEFARNADAFVKGVASKVNEKKEEMEDAFEDDFDEDLEEAEDLAEEAGEVVEEACGEGADAVKEACECAADAAQEACEEAVGAAEDAVEAAADAAEDTVEAAADAAEEAVESAAEAAGEAAEEMKTEA